MFTYLAYESCDEPDFVELESLVDPYSDTLLKQIMLNIIKVA